MLKEEEARCTKRDRRATVREVRVSLTVEDFEGAMALYSDALGLPVVEGWDEPHGRGIVLAAGAATIEILDRSEAEFVDEIEAGKRISGPVRLALGVADVEKTAGTLRERGAEMVNRPVMTPWGDVNQRLRTPDGMQLTLFSTD